MKKIVSLPTLKKILENNAVKSVVQFLQNLLCNSMKPFTKINFLLNQNSKKSKSESYITQFICSYLILSLKRNNFC